MTRRPSTTSQPPAPGASCTQAEPTIRDLNAAIRQARAIVRQTGAVALVIIGPDGYTAMHEPDYHFAHLPNEIAARVYSADEVIVYSTPVTPDPEATCREADPAPTCEILDAPPLDCVQPVITTQAAQAQVVAAAFGTRPPRPLRPARQDNIFEPLPQLSLFSGGR